METRGKTAEIRVIWPQAKEHLGLPEARGGKEGYFPRGFEGGWPCGHLDLRLLASRTGRE